VNGFTLEVMDVMEVIEVEFEGKAYCGTGLGMSKNPVFLRPIFEYCVQL